MIAGQLHKLGSDEILWRCVLPHEQGSILEESHGGFLVNTRKDELLQERCFVQGFGGPAYIMIQNDSGSF